MVISLPAGNYCLRSPRVQRSKNDGGVVWWCMVVVVDGGDIWWWCMVVVCGGGGVWWWCMVVLVVMVYD